MIRRILSSVAVAALALALVPTASAASAGPASGQDGARYQVTEMIKGATIHGANGLAIDRAGRLLVASVWGAEIVVVDPQTGAIEDRLGSDVRVDSPDDVAIGPDGSLYWTDLLSGEVGRLAPDGTVTKQFVAQGMNPIAFTADGRLFVAQAFFGDGLYELDPNLVEDPQVIIPDHGEPPFLDQLNGFDFGPDGMLYAPQLLGNRILRIDPETGDTWIVADNLPDGPSSVEFDSNGRLFATLGERVVTVDLSDGALTTVATIRGAGLDNMVFDARGRIFVSDSDSGAVYRVVGHGVRTLVPGGVIMPGGVAVMQRSHQAESLYVADLWSLAEFDTRSGRLIDVDNQSRGGGSITEPWTVAPDDGNVIVSSWMSNAVQVWDPDANQVVETYTFALPMNALRFQGDLVVAELGTGSVVRQDDAGVRTTVAGNATLPALPPPGLIVPIGLAATDTELWVSDWATGIVWLLVGDGAPRIVAGGLANPEGMAVDRDGTLLVVESGAGRLSRIDPVTGAVSTVAEGLAMDVHAPVGMVPPGIPPGYVKSSVAVDSRGTIFVSGAGAEQSVIYRIRAIPAR